jgi:hypothetical protein
MQHVPLTPGQAVWLHGWAAPKPVLRWADVVDSEAITFARCRAANLSLRQLHTLQPDVTEWVKHGGVTLRDAADMCELWTFDVLRDFGADLADVLSQRWGADTLRRMGATYERLARVGLTPETMRLFGFTARGWAALGMRRENLDALSDAHIHAVFALTRQEAESCFAPALDAPRAP